ncbi:MauE/DoxX family redox-associated membrane protein [Streptomyces sp. NPDC057445]|uniref:MauE/DoxX family redox-associated membrane protein n=1 Tax=Streptomyces sp. NPDC057445 TaxID=3346136 RepID=UPI0036A7F274
MEHIGEGGRILLGLVFLCSVVGKVRPSSFRGFRGAVRRMLPETAPSALPGVLASVVASALGHARRGATAVAAGVLVGEAAVVVALAVPATARAGFVLAAVLLTAFTVGLAGVLRWGTRTSCHCFGTTAGMIAPRHVVRNVLLIATAFAGATASHGGGTAPTAGLMLTAGVAVVLAFVTVALDDLVGLFAPAGHTSERDGAPR